MSVKKLLVAGAGQMGAGIVQVSAVAGLDVVMIDVADEFIARGMAGIEKGLGRLVDKGRMEAAARDAALARITTSTDMAAGADADLFIEAAPESMELKEDLFEQAAATLRPDAIIATNTSSLSVSELAAFVTEPERFVGIHFFNPVPMMALVEVVRGAQTSDETLAAARAFAEAVGKTPITVKDSPGFVVNRILFPMINEAAQRLRRGRGQRRGHRHRHEARRQLADGPAGARRPRRARHDEGHPRDARARARRRQVPRRPRSLGELRRRRQARAARAAPGSTTTGSDAAVTPLERRLRPDLHRRRQGQDDGRAGARRCARSARACGRPCSSS